MILLFIREALGGARPWACAPFALPSGRHCTGYSSCTKCWDEGEYYEQRICFSDKAGKERTDQDFFLKNDDNYHLCASVLNKIPFLGLVTNVPLDYLHLICLGVVKKLIHLWFCDSLKMRLQFRKIKIISNLLKNNVHPYAFKNSNET